MGREIFSQIRDRLPDLEDAEYNWEADPHCLWNSEDFVCGRDDATGYICCCTDESGVFAVLEGSNLECIRKELSDYAKSDREAVQDVRQRLERLLKAQLNARNYEEFNSFDEDIDNCKDWLESESFSRAQSLLDLIDKTLAEYQSGKYDMETCKPYLVVSE